MYTAAAAACYSSPGTLKVPSTINAIKGHPKVGVEHRSQRLTQCIHSVSYEHVLSMHEWTRPRVVGYAQRRGGTLLEA